MNQPKISQPKTRILIKVSGGCLADCNQHQLFSYDHLQSLIEQLQILRTDYQIALVVGGGNIWRGKNNHLPNLADHTSHYVGMLATIMNGLVLQSCFVNAGLKTQVFSSVPCGNLAPQATPDLIEKAFADHDVLIFAGGTGLPYLSTDTAAAIRAAEIGAKMILMGKDQVDGVFDADPKTNPDAQFFSHLTYQELISKQLEVMDVSAVMICEANQIEILVFNQLKPKAFVLALNNQLKLTKINNQEI